jgi:hypothetical protein
MRAPSLHNPCVRTRDEEIARLEAEVEYWTRAMLRDGRVRTRGIYARYRDRAQATRSALIAERAADLFAQGLNE